MSSTGGTAGGEAVAAAGRGSPSWRRRMRRQRALLLIPYAAAVVALTMVIGYRPPTWPGGAESLAASAPGASSPAERGDGRASPSDAAVAEAGPATDDPAGTPSVAGGPSTDATAATGATGSGSRSGSGSGAATPAPAAGAAQTGPSGADGSYAPTSTTAPAPDASLDERDVRSVLGLVFDLGRPWSQKAPYIEAADVLAAPYQQLVAATSAFGAVELRVADVQVQGDQAPFTVDAYLNGALVRPAIPGTAERVGPAWRLTRSSVCGALSVVAITCPA